MSADVSTVPPWKQAILERKRKQDDSEKRRTEEESNRLAQMPSWKREIILKKQSKTSRSRLNEQTQGKDVSSLSNESAGAVSSAPLAVLVNSDSLNPSPVQLRVSDKQLSPLCPTAEYDFEAVSDGEHENQERIIPIQQNPWLKSDSTKKHSSSSTSQPATHTKDSSVGSDTKSLSTMHDLTSPHVSNNSWSEDIESKNEQAKITEDDDVFSEEGEMAYGRGFVHKLLQKFKNITSQSDLATNSLPRKSPSPNIKRLASADTLLDSSSKRTAPPRPRSAYGSSDISLHTPTTNLSKKAQSMENILIDHSSSEGFLKPCEFSNLNCSQSLENIPSEIVGYSMDSENFKQALEADPEAEMPRPRIVSMTRDVFESISSPISITSSLGKPVTPDKKHSPKFSLSEEINDNEQRSSTSFGEANFNKHNDVNGSLVSEEQQANTNPNDVKTNGEVDVSVNKIKTAGKSWFFSGNDISKKQNGDASQLPVHDNGDQNANFSSNVGSSSAPVISTAHENTTSSSTKNDNNSVYQNKMTKTAPEHNHVQEDSVDNSNKNLPDRLAHGTKSSAVSSIVKSFSHTKSNAPEPKLAPKPVYTKPVAPSWNANKASLKPSSQETESNQEVRKPDPNRLNLDIPVDSSKNSEQISSKPVNSLPQSKKKSTVKEENQKNKASFKKAEPKGPGSLLIRPASNLVVGATKTEYLQLTRYNDVKTGEFAPAKKRPGYYDTYSDSEDETDDIPVTNIDDCLPVSNIDDLSPREGDATQHKSSRSSKWDFIGGGVTVGKSSLSKSKGRKVMRITFGEEVSSTYEYPSEQFLLESMPPQPGDFDHPDTMKNQCPPSPEVADIPDMDQPSSGLKSTPGLSAGALSNYQSKSAGEYRLGLDTYQMELDKKKKAPSPPTSPTPEAEGVKPADEDFTWSESSSADLLF